MASLVSSRVSTRLSVATEFWSSPSLNTTSDRRPGCLPTVLSAVSIASYSAVPPHGASRSTARRRSAGSVARRASVKMLSLNASKVTWSAGRRAARNVRTAAFSVGIASVMLWLTSTATTISSGMFSPANAVRRCGTSSSFTRNWSRASPLTKRPSLSVTVAVTCTTSTSTAST